VRKAIVTSLVLLFLSAQIASSQTPFVLIMYDGRSEKELGAFPPSRTVWAKAIEALDRLDARAVVMKFFFDLPRSDAEDKALAKAMEGLPTILQARIDDAEPEPNPLDTRFAVTLPSVPNPFIHGGSGWLPLAALSRVAYDVGFVDIARADSIPMLVTYRGKTYKSLWLSALQLAVPGLTVGEKAVTAPGRAVALNRYGEAPVTYPKKDEIEYRGVADLLRGDVDRTMVAGRVVIVGYDGDTQDLLSTPVGKMKAHRAFWYSLLDLYRRLVR
jgi:hypothetical protein